MAAFRDVHTIVEEMREEHRTITMQMQEQTRAANAVAAATVEALRGLQGALGRQRPAEGDPSSDTLAAAIQGLTDFQRRGDIVRNLPTLGPAAASWESIQRNFLAWRNDMTERTSAMQGDLDAVWRAWYGALGPAARLIFAPRVFHGEDRKRPGNANNMDAIVRLFTSVFGKEETRTERADRFAAVQLCAGSYCYTLYAFFMFSLYVFFIRYFGGFVDELVSQ